MPAAGLPRVCVLVWGALVVGASGCEGCREPASGDVPEEAPAPEPESPAPPRAPRRVGVKVPMPAGWNAQVAPDGSFQFGPPGHPVLRVDVRSGQGGALPGPDVLAERVAESFAGFERAGEQREQGRDVSLVRVRLTPPRGDGGGEATEPYPALFGARRVEKDLFLCSTLPGVSAAEVEHAAEACAGIELQPRQGP